MYRGEGRSYTKDDESGRISEKGTFFFSFPSLAASVFLGGVAEAE